MSPWLLVAIGLLSVALADNEFTYTGTPVAGQPFTITWTPGMYDKIDILLWSLTGSPYYVPTTSVPIATEIQNTGSYVWDVPATLTGFHEISIARDFAFSVSYGPKFALGGAVFSTISYATTVPQSTACTSALPAPTGFSPFIDPSQGFGSVMRVDVPFDISWQPTTDHTVSLILNPQGSAVAPATIISNITNSGSYTWTPPNDPTLIAQYGWTLSLVDDVTGDSSDSDSFNILTPSAKNSFIGPFPPPVMGQDHTFYWSPSTSPTVSILIVKAVALSTVNVTLADKIENTGTFTWSVPKTDDIIIPGEWEFYLVDDATGNADSIIYLTIDAETPAVCGPQTSDWLSSLIVSLHGTKTTATIAKATTSVSTLTGSLNSAYQSILSLESARTATITRVTPVVKGATTRTLTSTPIPTTGISGSGSGSGSSGSGSSTSGTKNGESQSSESLTVSMSKSTGAAAAATAQVHLGGVLGMGIGLLGFLGGL